MIPIFIGYDKRERAATNVLIDSLYQNCSLPLSITPLVTEQLENEGLFYRERDPNQSTAFSFTRFLVPYLMDFKGWAFFMDCDMLCKSDIAELWNKKEEKYSVMCAKHQHIPSETKKFLGEKQSVYPKKNWSSLMLLNCSKCKKLSIEYVNEASGLELHRFLWLENDSEIGEIDGNTWNYLVDVNSNNEIPVEKGGPKLLHWTLGGPWFKDQRKSGSFFSSDWFIARHDAMKLWD